MTRVEFATVIVYLEAICGKQLPPASMDPYFDLLGDLPSDVLRTAAQRVAVEHRWATFPSVAELREAAIETIQGSVKELSPAEAWDLAWSAAGRIDLEIEGSIDRACKDLPVTVLEAMRAFGVPALVYGKEPVGVVRGQFLKIFEQLAARDRRRALLPASVKNSIAEIGARGQVAGSVGKIVESIGKEIEGDKS